MRRPWIKIETCTPDKPEICSIATQLRMDPDTVVGKLVRLWSWAELNRITPHDLGVTREFLDKLVGRKGFARALEQTGWLVETDGTLSFRNFQRHNHPVAHSRALTAKRVARHRLRKLKAAAANADVPASETPMETPPPEVTQPPEYTAPPVENGPQEPAQEEAPPTEEPHVFTEASQESVPTVESPPEPESPAPEEEAPEPKKRRSRSSGDSPDQPMLF